LKNDVAQKVAAQYGVDRKTIYNDARFVRALDRVVEVCGESLRQAILSCRIKGTSKGFIEQLAKREESEIKQQVEKARKADHWPSLPSNGKIQKIKRVGLPVGKPKAQARLLLGRLGRKGIVRLIPALDDLMQAKETNESR
jgi:hypothetical protein